MEEWQKKKVLMFVKTYPTPSAKYHETVCTAGVSSEGEWLRLYPVQFRYLKPEQKFEKYSWIEIDTVRNTQDFRPESYRANADSIKIIKKLDSKNDLEERKQYILPLCSRSFDSIQRGYELEKRSLGLFKPSKVHDLLITPAEKEWTNEQLNILSQTSFFDTETKQLEKVPWDFSFVFDCDDPNCKGSHKLKITDWEIYQTYRNFRRSYRSEKEALSKLKEKYLEIFTDPRRDSYMIVGTVIPWPTFIIIGLFTYLKSIKTIEPNKYEQISLF